MKPLASVSIDLDNLWSYQKIHGDAGWESFPSYYDAIAELAIDRLRRHGLTITLFVVGQDAALDKNRAALRALAAEGHEIGNHSFSHEPWFHAYSADEVGREIARAEEAIEAATGKRPRGFRGPGYSLSPDTLAVLARRGYLYDASTFPTFLGPLARAYYFWKSRGMADADKAKRKQLFGRASEGLRPIRPYLWNLPDRPIVEIPVTTMPLARLPIHMSYILYLALFSESLAMSYLATALALCSAGSVEPSFLFHPLDFLGGDRVKELAFFPGMKHDTATKLRLFDRIIERIKRRFEPVTMAQHAERLLERGQLRRRTLA